MSTMTPMIEYLLSLRLPEGGQLARYGGMQTTVPIFPPNFEITWITGPFFGSYCSIEFWHRFSPAMVPGSFTIAASHVGVELMVGTIGAAWTSEGHNIWAEFTDQNPGQTTIRNISGLAQFFESFETFLLVDSEINLNHIREITRNWGAFESVKPSIEATNDLLRRMLGEGGPRMPVARGGR